MLINGKSVADLVRLGNRHSDMLGMVHYRATKEDLKNFSGSELEALINSDIVSLHLKIVGEDISELSPVERYRAVCFEPELGLVEDNVLEFIVEWLRFHSNELGNGIYVYAEGES